MPFHLASSEDAFHDWLAQGPTEDELRDAYLRLETKRAGLWSSGHIDSFRRDRYELDSQYVDRLVRIKWALTRLWTASGQFERLTQEPHFV